MLKLGSAFIGLAIIASLTSPSFAVEAEVSTNSSQQTQNAWNPYPCQPLPSVSGNQGTESGSFFPCQPVVSPESKTTGNSGQNYLGGYHHSGSGYMHHGNGHRGRRGGCWG